MSHRDHHNLIQLGRKAGLNTAELYRALTTRPPDRQSVGTRQTDFNGFSGDLAPGGRVEYHPAKKRG
jgi:hypothetical protein